MARAMWLVAMLLTAMAIPARAGIPVGKGGRQVLRSLATKRPGKAAGSDPTWIDRSLTAAGPRQLRALKRILGGHTAAFRVDLPDGRSAVSVADQAQVVRLERTRRGTVRVTVRRRQPGPLVGYRLTSDQVKHLPKGTDGKVDVKLVARRLGAGDDVHGIDLSLGLGPSSDSPTRKAPQVLARRLARPPSGGGRLFIAEDPARLEQALALMAGDHWGNQLLGAGIVARVLSTSRGRIQPGSLAAHAVREAIQIKERRFLHPGQDDIFYLYDVGKQARFVEELVGNQVRLDPESAELARTSLERIARAVAAEAGQVARGQFAYRVSDNLGALRWLEKTTGVPIVPAIVPTL